MNNTGRKLQNPKCHAVFSAVSDEMSDARNLSKNPEPIFIQVVEIQNWGFESICKGEQRREDLSLQ